jgi:cyclohexanone monooxygenase
VVGAGFSGLYLLYRLRKLGFRALALEAASGVGGTWWWNRYPGARCDVESMQYSFSFSEELQQEWRWSEKFSAQPEILTYAEHVADRFDLRRDIRFGSTVKAAHFDETARRWRLETDGGVRYQAQFCVMATGCLSTARVPDFEGRDSFRGPTYHTGYWPHEGVDFTGQRVGLIGTGSSAIQAIPAIAEAARHLTVFQRTPNYSIPTRNGPMTPEYERSWKEVYAERRAEARQTKTGVLAGLNDVSAMSVSAEERRRVYRQRWADGGTYFMAAFNDLATNQESNDSAAEFVRQQIRSIVKDPAVRETPIDAITAVGLVAGGRAYEFDSLVFATGFDAMTGTLAKIDIRGRGRRRLVEKWAAGPRTYLGLMTEGFPNLFTITGPGSPSVLSNMMVSIEQHVDWVSDGLDWLRARGLETMEPSLEAEDAWVRHNDEVAHKTLYPKAASWYMGANIPGKPRIFLPYIGGVGAYRERCEAIARNGYEGFHLTPARLASAAAE